MKYTVTQNRVGFVAGVFLIALFSALFVLLILLQTVGSSESTETFISLVAVDIAFICLGAAGVYRGVRPRVRVENRTVTYYPRWKRKRTFDVSRVKRKATFSQTREFEKCVAEFVFYDGDGELLCFTEDMKYSDRLDALLVSEIRSSDSGGGEQ